MRSVSDLLRERRAWTDGSARAFLRNIILPRCHKPTRTAAVDAAPHEPSLAPEPNWTVTQPDAAAMREASTIVEFYAGVPFSVGQQREAAFRLRKLERRLEL